MNPMMPRDCVDRGWTKVTLDLFAYKNLDVVNWVEQTVGEDNWTVWFGNWYFENPAHATLFKLRWVK